MSIRFFSRYSTVSAVFLERSGISVISFPERSSCSRRVRLVTKLISVNWLFRALSTWSHRDRSGIRVIGLLSRISVDSPYSSPNVETVLSLFLERSRLSRSSKEASAVIDEMALPLASSSRRLESPESPESPVSALPLTSK